MGNRDETRVVITGMGVISPLGENVETFWEAVVAGRSGVGPMTLADPASYPCRIAAEVRDWQPERHIDRKEARRMARFSQFAVAAAGQALADAGVDPAHAERERLAVLLGNGNGGYPDIDQAMRVIVEKGGMRIDPFFMPKSLPNMAAAQVALQFGLKGYNGTVVTACAAATQAVGEAFRLVRDGRADAVVTGGTEAGISELGLAAFSVMRALSTRNDAPQRASRPFDRDRDGFVPGEGAACFIVERLDHALARGATPLAELIGFAVTADAYHLVAPCADGEGAGRAIRLALQDAGLGPEEVDYINAHGTSTPLNDVSETKAIKAALGEHAYRVPVSSTKSMIGHALGASGALELVATVQALRTGWVHPTVNLDNPDPECDLDYVPNRARRVEPRVALKESFGFGGQNAVLALRRWEG